MVDATVGSGDFVLSGLSFRVDRGQYAVIMGRTGIGKTTILESICGLVALKSGRVIIQDQDVTKWGAADRNVGYVPQDLALFPTMTVNAHLEFAMRLRHVPKGTMRSRVGEIAEILRIEKLLDRKITGLSGGEAQRVALGRALTFGPAVLLLDEPLSALDSDTHQAVQSMLREINEKTGVTVLHVTHNQTEAASLADQQILIESNDNKATITIQ
jgi:ABC-type sugar transport system ATPase subunit